MALSILKNGRTRLAFQFGRASALRSTSEKEKEIAILIRDLMRLKYELAQRDMIDAFANVQSPSAMTH